MSLDKQFVDTWIPHRKFALHLCRQLLGEELLAEDALQEVYLKLWSKRSELQGISDPKAYLLRTCRNHCLSLLRAQGHVFYSLSEELDIPQLDEETLAEKRMEREMQFSIIEEWTKALEEPLATLWHRLQIEGATSAIVAQELGMSEGNVRVRLSRLRKNLREYIINQGSSNKNKQ